MGENEAGRTPDGEPRPVADIDGDDLFDYLQPLHRMRWLILTGAGLVMLAALILLGVGYSSQSGQLRAARQVIAAQQREIGASCRFYRTATGLPLRPTPPLTRPSPVVVTLIASSRDAYRGERCRPELGPPPPELARWAAQYKVPLGRLPAR